jgi:enoyl-CoA hydratase
MSVLDVEVSDGIAVLTMNRPDKRNAIDPEMMVRLADGWTRVREDDALRVAVLTGAGTDTFCAGGDLRTLIPLLTRARPAADEWDERLLQDQRGVVNTAMLRVADFPKPIIAAVNGLCLAGGMELMLATDLRVAAEHTELALTEVQRGLIPGGGSVARLPRQVPAAVAMELLMVGDRLPASRAYDVGLLNAVVPGDQVLPRALTLARRIAANAPLAVREVKAVCLASPGLPLAEAFALEDDAVRRVMRSEDAKEGARAFAERREPNFTGR